MNFRYLTEPAEEPVTLAEAKAHMRLPLDLGDQDETVRFLISVARQRAEFLTGRTLINRECELIVADAVCADLQRPPLGEVLAVSALDEDGVESEVVVGGWRMDYARLLPRLSVKQRVPGAVALKVRYRAGYGSIRAQVPYSIRQWIKLYVNTLDLNREAVLSTSVSELPATLFDGLLDEYLVPRLA